MYRNKTNGLKTMNVGSVIRSLNIW